MAGRKSELKDALDDQTWSPDAGEERVVRIDPEDLVEETAIIITPEELLDGNLHNLLRTPLMRQFIGFVSAGLPDVFLRSHEELLKPRNHKKIQETIDEISDQVLRNYLVSRLEVVKKFQENKKDSVFGS